MACGRTTVDLGQVGQLREGMFVPEGDIDQSVVDKGGEGVGDGDLLSTTLGAGGDEDTAHLASKGAPCPQWTGCVPECLMDPMRRDVIHGFEEDAPSTARESYQSE